MVLAVGRCLGSALLSGGRYAFLQGALIWTGIVFGSNWSLTLKLWRFPESWSSADTWAADGAPWSSRLGRRNQNQVLPTTWAQFIIISFPRGEQTILLTFYRKLESYRTRELCGPSQETFSDLGGGDKSTKQPKWALSSSLSAFKHLWWQKRSSKPLKTSLSGGEISSRACWEAAIRAVSCWSCSEEPDSTNRVRLDPVQNHMWSGRTSLWPLLPPAGRCWTLQRSTTCLLWAAF